MRPWLVIALLPALVVAPGLARAEDAPVEPETGARLVVLFTSDLRGALVEEPCEAGAAPPLLPVVSAVVREERARGAAPVLLLDAGDALFPSPLVRDLASRPDSARALAEALRTAGYDALATGNTIVAAPRPAFRGFAGAAREAGLPLVLTNVECSREGGEGCETTVAGLTERRAVIERAGLRIGVISLLPEDLPERVSRENVEGTRFREPIAATSRAVLALREEGADLVVLLSHADRSDNAPRATLEILSRLAPAESPDLVIAASTAGLATRIRTAGEGPTVLAVSGESVGRALLERGPGGRWETVEAGSVEPEGPPDELLGRVLASFRAVHCATGSRPLAGGRLASAMDRDDFLALLERMAREETRAELSVLNRAMVNGRPFPREGVLTPSVIRRALPYETELRVAMVTGKALLDLAPRLLGAPALAVSGLTKRDSSYYVNGRVVDADARYRLVTNDFLATGGDGLFERAEEMGFSPAPPDEAGNVSAADRLVAWVDLRPPGELLDPDLRLDLHTRPLWHGSTALTLSISDSHIDDRVGYDEPQLRRQGLLDMRFGLELRGGMSTRDHSWDNLVQLRYGRQRLETEVGSGSHEWGESSDLINVRSGYTMDHVRNHLLEGAWYGPSLFVEYTLESEFDHDGEGAHFLEMTGTGGLRLTPVPWLRLQAGAAVRSRVLAEDARAVPGLALRAEVVRSRFFPRVRAPVYLAGLVDYFLGWPGGGEAHKLTAEGRIEVEVLGPLRLSASVRFFLYQEPGLSLATAVDSTLGLTVAMSQRLQTY